MNQVAARPFPLIAGRRLSETLDKLRNVSWGYGAIAFCLVHIPLALILSRFNALSTLHGFVVFGVGMWFALTTPDRPLRIAYVGAYITGAEVLWRMTNSQVFWEFGKYATAAIFLVAIFRSGRLKGPATMLTFFALLLPSIGVLVMNVGLFQAKGYLSFFLSGPFAMMVAAWFFSRQRLSVEHIRQIFLVAAGPIIGIASITFFSTYSAQDLTFTDESNFITSGGFGPNQVSAALGLGALFALMFVLLGKTRLALKVFMLGAMLLLAAQSAMTFSRGGLYNFAGATAFASVFLLRDSRTRRTLLLVAVIAFVVGSFVILPRLEDLSGGKLTSRFTDTNTTNRVQIVENELKVWRMYPILGAGPGGSHLLGAGTAHTEFFRFPADHGILGVVALLLLLIAAVQNIKKAKSVKARAIAVCLIGWSCLFMLNAALRLVAPAFVFGLAFATVLPEISPSLLRELLARVRARTKGRAAFQRKAASARMLRTNLQ